MTRSKAAEAQAERMKANTRALRLNDEVTGLVASYLRSGCFLTDACKLSNVNVRRATDWRRRGRLEAERIEEGGKPKPAEEPYLTFWRETEQARVRRKVRALTVLQDLLADDDHNIRLKAATWFLERGWPDEFGRRIRIEENEKRPEEAEPADPEADRRAALAMVDELQERRTRKSG